MKKSQAVEKPLRDPDHVSKRGVWYFFAPEWVRGTSGQNISFGRIKAIREPSCRVWNNHHNGCECPDTCHLYMLSKDGNMTYIQGSIQEEFRQWHDDRQIDYILLGETPGDATDLVITETEDTKYE